MWMGEKTIQTNFVAVEGEADGKPGRWGGRPVEVDAARSGNPCITLGARFCLPVMFMMRRPGAASLDSLNL
jgi:hypothetical protein